MTSLVQPIDTPSIIDQIESSGTIESAVEIFAEFISIYGFDSYLIGTMANPASQTKNDIVTNWPKEWIDRWVDQNYVFHDPIFQYAMRTRDPFKWSTAYECSSKIGKKIIDESREFDFYDGITIPISTNYGPLGCVSLGAKELNITDSEIGILELISIHLYQYLQMLKNPKSPDIFGILTKREKEVLHFVAEGKTNWEIGKILNLSEYSIKDHMQNLTRKLNVANRTQAVAVAVRNGLIIP